MTATRLSVYEALQLPDVPIPVYGLAVLAHESTQLAAIINSFNPSKALPAYAKTAPPEKLRKSTNEVR